MSVQVHGLASLAELFGDLVIYRNLEPVDRRLPSFREAWREMGLDSPRRPRKVELAYAKAAIWFLQQARMLERPGVALQELLFIGDTLLSDGNAFRNLAGEAGWLAWAFIGAEKIAEQPRLTAHPDNIVTANRWMLLPTWLAQVLADGARCDEQSVLLIDVDKTALAARGRNNQAIDRAREEALFQTAEAVLGFDFPRELFLEAYRELNQSRYHTFTGDNQDYLAHICLSVAAGVVTLPELQAALAQGVLRTFPDFLRWVETRPLPPGGFVSMQEEVHAAVVAGDPTPFKGFRRQEFRATVARMGHLPLDRPLSERLQQEICLTQEVRDVARWARQRGCLVMALSDKPDEAVLPDAAAASVGLLPLHRTLTHAVGKSVDLLLP